MRARENSSRMEANSRTGARAADETRLLQGEDPATRDPEDVLHWISVYRELCDFKDVALGMIEERRSGADPAVDTELGTVDVPLLSREREHYQVRLEFWERRRAEL